jgi:hypothetical protein
MHLEKMERLEEEYQETVEECVQKHQNEMESLEEALEVVWNQEIRNQCKRERDKDIELMTERPKLKQHRTRSSEWNLDYGGVL